MRAAFRLSPGLIPGAVLKEHGYDTGGIGNEEEGSEDRRHDVGIHRPYMTIYLASRISGRSFSCSRTSFPRSSSTSIITRALPPLRVRAR